MLEGKEDVGFYPMIKDLNQILEHIYSTLTYEKSIEAEYRKEIILQLLKIDDMIYYIRHFMSSFFDLLIKDFRIYIDNTSYINWGVFFIGFIFLLVGWYFVLKRVQESVSGPYTRMKKILRIYP